MITSRSNPAVKEVREALRRRPPQAFVLEGPHLVAEALAAGIELSILLIGPDARDALSERARARAHRALDVSTDVLTHAADSQHPQGMVAVGRVPALVVDDARAREGLVLVLDEIRDPGNLGTIVRTAWAAGAAAVLLVGSCVDPWSPKVVRAAAGGSFHVPVLSMPSREDAASWLAAHGQRVIEATAHGRLTCFEADLAPPIALVLGNEAHGVHPDTSAFCHDSLRLPMEGGCESLNLAVTAAVLCYLSRDRAQGLRSRRPPSVHDPDGAPHPPTS